MNKEEPKQEPTLEEAARLYSEEDMAESFMACWKANVPEGFECKLSFNEWFKQFKVSLIRVKEKDLGAETLFGNGI